MAINLFNGKAINFDMENGHMAMQRTYVMFGRDFVLLVVVVAFLSFVLHCVDKVFYSFLKLNLLEILLQKIHSTPI